MIQFILNNETIETNQPLGMVMADFIRYHQDLKGTKLGCREGDCGACTILVGSLQNGKIIYQPMTSCLMPLGNAWGKHIVTVEGLNIAGLNVPQQALLDEGGTQCGFCTPGFVVSLAGFALSQQVKSNQNAINAVAGNICRCTGYQSIKRAIDKVVGKLQTINERKQLDSLVKKQFLPAYFLEIPARLETIAPPIIGEQKPTVWVAGGTDLYVQKPTKMRVSSLGFWQHRTDLKGIWKKDNTVKIGASTTAEELKQSVILTKVMGDNQAAYFDLISSLQIRNMATVAGNLVNASPIGDLSILFLALSAHVVLNEEGSLRTLPLRQFYKGYKQLDKKEKEYLQELHFDLPEGKFYFNFEKVSKRTHLDIATVNTAMLLELDDENHVKKAAISAGGVAATPLFLSKTVAFLLGKKISKTTLEQSLDIALEEVNPISDVRGTAAYKKLLLGQLIKAHYIEFFPKVAEDLLCYSLGRCLGDI